MCFSAAASFTAASILVTLGAICLALIPLRSKPSMTNIQKLALSFVAAIPLIFGLHQLSEGFVWLDNENQVAIKCFTYTAYTIWPAYFSLASTLTEFTRPPKLPEGQVASWPRSISFEARRWLLVLNSALALALLVLLVVSLRTHDDTIAVMTENGRLEYMGWGLETSLFYTACSVYVYTVIGTMVVSSLPYSSLCGFAILVALIITFLLWTDQIPSTWCFFAAIISIFNLWIIWKELQTYQEDHESETVESSATPIKPSRDASGSVGPSLDGKGAPDSWSKDDEAPQV